MENAGHARLKTSRLSYGRRRAANLARVLGSRGPRSEPAVDECVAACSSPECRSCQGCAEARSADGAGLLLLFQGGGSCSYSGRVVEEPTQ